MIAQSDPELFSWVVNAEQKAGSFLKSLAEAAIHADFQNYPILRPVLLSMKEKYPEYNTPRRAESCEFF